MLLPASTIVVPEDENRELGGLEQLLFNSNFHDNHSNTTTAIYRGSKPLLPAEEKEEVGSHFVGSDNFLENAA